MKVLILVLILFFFFQIYFMYVKKTVITNRIMPLTFEENFPRIIFRTYNDKTVCNEMFKNCHQKWVEFNPNYSIIWFSNNECDEFMKKYFKGTVNEAYKCLKPGAYKADLWRLCILYKFGGFYVDAFVKPYASLREMIKNCKTNFISVLDSELSGKGIHNGFIASTKKHPFLKQAILDIVLNVKKRFYGSCPLSVTGPIALSKSINKVVRVKISNNHKIGLNQHGILSYYLFNLNYGLQNVYKKEMKIMTKYFSFFYYLYRKLWITTGYTKMWKQKNIFDLK